MFLAIKAINKDIKGKRKFCRQYLETIFFFYVVPDPFRFNSFRYSGNFNSLHTVYT